MSILGIMHDLGIMDYETFDETVRRLTEQRISFSVSYQNIQICNADDETETITETDSYIRVNCPDGGKLILKYGFTYRLQEARFTMSKRLFF